LKNDLAIEADQIHHLRREPPDIGTTNLDGFAAETIRTSGLKV
jgi:hypothetical protein